jgi:hypothetical protein
MTSAITRPGAGAENSSVRWRGAHCSALPLAIRAQASLPFGRLVAKPVPSWARQVHMAGPCHSWKARWAVGVGPRKAVASTSALERESPNRPLLPGRVIPIRLTATEDVATPFALSVPACGDRQAPAAPRPPPAAVPES